MPSDRSFTDYIKTRFYNDIYSAVDGFVEQSWEGFDLRISNVHIIGADTRGRFYNFSLYISKGGRYGGAHSY